MKFIGQYIQKFIARFKNDVFLEDVGSGTIASGGNLGLDSNNKIVKANVPTTHDAVTLAGSLDYITLSGQEITRNAIDLAADVTGTLPVGNGGTGATSLTDNAVLLGNGSSAVEASSHLSYYTPGSNLDYLLIGDSSTTTSGIVSNNAAPISIQVDANTGTDAAGSDMTFIAGTSTGNAAGGSFKFRSSPTTGSSGTSVNVPSEIAALDNAGNLQLDGGITTGSTSFVNSSGVIQTAAQTNITSLGTLTGLTIGGDLTVNGDTVTIESANADDPHVLIKNTNNGTNEGARLDFNKLRADDGTETGQNLGEIHFTGQDSAQNTQSYGYIIGEIDVGTSGQESGQIVMGVANHDGGQATGFKLTGGSQNDEIDAEIGFGTSSLTTIAGTLTMGSTATLDNSGNLLTNAATATALETSRNLQVDLASTSAQGFTGAANATSIGVNGTLPVANGGTGLTSISTLLNSNVPHYDYLHINCQMTATSTNQYMGYGGHYNFNIGATAYTDGGGVNNKNSTKWSHYQAITAATIHTVMYNFTTTGGNVFVFELWEIVPGSGSSNNTTNLLKQYSISGNSSNDFILTATDTTGYSLAAGAGLLPVIRKVSSAWSGNIFGEITIKFQY